MCDVNLDKASRSLRAAEDLFERVRWMIEGGSLMTREGRLRFMDSYSELRAKWVDGRMDLAKILTTLHGEQPHLEAPK